MKQVEVVSDIARAIVNDWALLAYQPLNNRFTMEYLAYILHCDIVFCGESGSSYMPDESEDGPLGVALIDPNGPTFVVVRRIAHELTHHVLFWWKELRYPYVHNDVVARLGASRELEEKICMAVTDLIVAAPFGFQPNGKMAIPRGHGFVLRIYNTQLAEWERLRGHKASQ